MTNIAVSGKTSIRRVSALRIKSWLSSLCQVGPRTVCVAEERDSCTARMMGLSASVRASKEISPSGEEGEEVLSVKGGIQWYVVCECWYGVWICNESWES